VIRQLRHVVQTYTSRKVLWLLATFYLLFMVINATDATNTWRDQPLLWQETQVQWAPRKIFDGMTAFLNWAATDDELRELRGLQINGQYVVMSDQLGKDGKPPATLQVDSDMTPEHLDKLTKCVRLTELHLLTVELTPALGQTLAKLPSLQHLELTLIGRPVPSMEFLPALANLRFFQVPQVPVAELGLLAKHPLLQTIELNDRYPQHERVNSRLPILGEIWQQPATLHQATQIERVIIKPLNEHTRAIFEGVPYDQIPDSAVHSAVPVSESLRSELAKLPNLNAVETRDPWGGWPVRTIDDPGLRQSLADRPQVAINPVVRNLSSVLSPFAAFGSTIVLIAIGIQLFSQFGTSWSQTVPGFAKPHLITAAALLLVHLSVSTTIMVIHRDIAWLPAFAILAAIPAAGAIAAAGVARMPTMLPLLLPLAFATAVPLSLAGTTILRALGGEAFIDGHRPLTTLLMLVLECAAIVWSARSLIHLARRFSEAGIPGGLGFMQTIQQMHMQKLNPTGPTKHRIGRNRLLLDRRLDSLLASEAPDRRRQWRAGEPTSWRHLMPMCLFIPWLTVGVFMLTMGLLSGQAMSPTSYVFFSVHFGTFSLAFATLVVAGGSQERRTVIQQELLRPMLRGELHRHLRTAIWIDLWPAALITLVYLSAVPFVYFWGPPGWISRAWVGNAVGHVLLCLTLPLLIWAALLLLLTIHSSFWRVLLILLGYILLFGFVQAFMIFRILPTTQSSWFATSGILWFAAICLILGTLLAYWANRRMPHVEWGAAN
jgi:hypothetical protein